jgi:hypothetical protein
VYLLLSENPRSLMFYVHGYVAAGACSSILSHIL